MTIYLWHNIAIDLAYPVNDWLGWPSLTAQIGTTVVLVAIAVFAFGWVEDVAGRRPVRLLPGGRRRSGPDKDRPPVPGSGIPLVHDVGGARSRR